jgi:hypothetical protein
MPFKREEKTEPDLLLSFLDIVKMMVSSQGQILPCSDYAGIEEWG